MVAITDAAGIRYEANTVADVLELVRQYRALMAPAKTTFAFADTPKTINVPHANAHPRGPLKSPLPAPPTGPANHGYGTGSRVASRADD